MYYRNRHWWLKYLILLIIAGVIYLKWGNINDYVDSKIKKQATVHVVYTVPSDAAEPKVIHHEDKVKTRTYDEADIVDKGFKVGWVRYHPHLKEKPFTTYVYTQKYDLSIEKYQTNDGYNTKNNLIETNQLGESRTLKIDKVNFHTYLQHKRFRWSPRFAVGMLANSNVIAPDLNLSLWSYGRSKRDMDWRFGIFGGGGNENTFVGAFSPFEYNLGNHIPYIENLFIGPSISVNTRDSNIGVGLQISIPF